MFRKLLLLALLVGLASPVWSQEKKEVGNTAEAVKADAGNAEVWNAFAGAQFMKISGLMRTDPAAAEKALAELESFLETTEPTSDAAKTIVGRIKSSITFYKRNVELAKVKLEDLEKDVAANPDDAAAVNKYVGKLTMELGGLARSEPEKAEALMKSAKELLAKTKEATKTEAVSKSIETANRTFASLERTIESTKKLAALVGKDAAPLSVSTWVNGKPLTDGDLKGKVVLLDFWAIWCGPCIATFPHLREWQEEYGDKGLVIIGVTSYYNYGWNDETKKLVPPKRGADGKPVELPHEEEHAMLEKFAEMHSLKHRFAIQDGRGMSEYYAVSGIPHVVVIDQQGKVQMVRVGSGEKNANDIGGLLKKLLADKPTTK